MNFSSVTRVELLGKDTWKIQMEALFVRNDLWMYASGELKKPVLIEGDVTSKSASEKWIREDNKARSDKILSISPSELKQVKGCSTSRDIWVKLQNIYQSKGPARKATLLKQLTLHQMDEDGDVRDHVNKFFDAVDKLQEMNVEINSDLLAIMLLYSLPKSFENFRCAIETRDDLPTPDTLRIKIIEESDARNNETRNRNSMQGVMYARKPWPGRRTDPNKLNDKKVGECSG